METEVVDGAAEIEVEDARLDPRVLVLGVHLEDPGEMGGDDHERVADGGRAARQTRAAAAGHERPAVASGDPNGGGDVGSARREAYGGGRTPGKRAVGLRVVMDGGAPVGLRASLIRNVIRLFECALTFYKDGDIGDDGEWDNWRLEGPAFVWYFRGTPHVHIWINVADEPSVPLNAKG